MKSPFFTKTLPCPACAEPATQTLLTSGLCYSADKESDGHTTRYGWRKTGIQKIHPPLYSLITCPECFFTDLVADYMKPPNSARFRRALKKHKDMVKSDQKIVFFLHKHIHFDRRSHADLLVQHFLSLFIYDLVPDADQDHRKIARLYIRIAWIYREKPNLSSFFSKFIKTLKHHWSAAPVDEKEAIQEAIPHFIEAINVDPFYQDNRNYINTLKLIGDLYLRAGELDGAFTFLQQVRQRSLAEKRKFELIYRDKKSDEGARRKARVELMRVGGFVRDVEQIEEDLVDRLNARDAHIIEPILSSGQSGEVMLKRLKAQGLHEAQLKRIQSSGQIKAPKKRFGIF